MKLLCILAALITLPSHAAKELIFDDVTPDVQQQIIDYNKYDYESAIYKVKRHRIVRVDAEALRAVKPGDDVVLPLFPDISITFRTTSVDARPDTFAWEGEHTNSPIFKALSDPKNFEMFRLHLLDQGFPTESMTDAHIRGLFIPQARISLTSYDVLPDNVARYSGDTAQTRARFRHWQFNDAGDVVLVAPEGQAAIAGPPPKTQEELEQLEQARAAEPRAFVSFMVFLPWQQQIDGRIFQMIPFHHDPAYALIVERDLNEPPIIPCIDEPCSPSPEAQAAANEKAHHMASYAVGNPRRPIRGPLE